MALRPTRIFVICVMLLALTGALIQAQADEPQTVTVAGTIQSLAGCPGDWAPECPDTFMTSMGDGIWEATFELPSGSYEYKIAINGSWDENYGLDGVSGGPNIPLVLESDMAVTFQFDYNSKVISDSVGTPAIAAVISEAVVPDLVNVPGTIQAELGCPGPWAPDCEASALEYLPEYDIFLRTFENLPAGSYEYKVAINGSWTENYGAFADQDGANIILNQPEDGPITFVYDHKTNWISDSVRHVIATVPGSFQSEIGCSGDWAPDCMLSWMQDVDGDGIYTFSTSMIPAGDYEAKIALNRSWDLNYGADGVQDGANISFSVPEDNVNVSFLFDSNANALVISVGGGGISGASIRAQGAYWVLADTLLWDVEYDPALSYRLLYSADASMRTSLFGLSGEFSSIDLTVDEMGPSEAVLAKFPHLAGQTAFRIAEADLGTLPAILKGQTAIAAYGADDSVLNITGLQIPGVLDDLYTYDGDLGITWDVNGVPAITLWAPTARQVNLHLFADGAPRTEATVLPMIQNAAQGTWRIVGSPSWAGQYYLFEVEVYAPSVMEIVTNLVTDPYSVSLATNSTRSQIVDLSSAALMPEGWADLQKPPLAAPEDITVYELHIRDFSAFDESVPEEFRGRYLAFTQNDSSGMQHLAALQAAGLTHLHLLPSFDIATINENQARWFDPDYAAMADMAPDSEEQQALIDPIRDLDGFNWGYDPYHFNVPEGSYSTDPDGVQRIIEYRQMVQNLNEMGLRVVQDVVYNHTNAAGQSARSVLDRIVPGYYHRLNARGLVETSTCCQNTATEHNMMRRLMIDSIILHATEYKIDAFRFDLMGHHMLTDMQAVREALDGLTLEEDGIDGASVYVYGEGWNFGEVVDNTRGINATQLNIAGTGIGVFNDRLRDAVRGGNPFGDRLEQGLANGQFTLPNGLDERGEDLVDLLVHKDQVRIGLAGNLSSFEFVDRNGDTVDATQVLYGSGEATGYTADPQENIIYVSKHDNETLFDNIAFKAPRDISMADRVRMQNLSLSYVMYSQGIPFFHAGSDMLRSKSLDRNSYNSGDWFNRLDFTYQTNNFGVGLPPAQDNETQWELMRPLLADPALVPAEADILQNVNVFQDMLRVRYSSPLLRLQTAEDVNARLRFHNTGPDQVPALIVMSISDTVEGFDDIDENYDMIVIIFNNDGQAWEFTESALAGQGLILHPALAEGSDEVIRESSFDAETGTFTVPGLTTAVFVLPNS